MPDLASQSQPSPSRLRTWALAACLFAIVLGLKWATFDRFGSSMPDWDQWDAEGSELLIPWAEGGRFLPHLFHPHNEHHVVMTKLQNLALTLLNGQWDSRLEAIVNAVLHTAFVVAFWCVGLGWLAGDQTRRHGDAGDQTRRHGDTETRRGSEAAVSASPPLGVSASSPTAWADAAWFLLLIVLFGLPMAWQNVLGGFHSQQYWLVALSFAAMVTLPFARTRSRAWWAAAIASGLALLTMGSGLLAPAIVFAVLGWRILRRETTLRDAWPTLLWTAILVTIGLATRVHFPDHEPLKAKTVHDFVFSILRSMEWPLRDHDWAGPVLWLPWLVVAWRTLRGHAGRATTASRIEQSLTALGGWVLLQIVATAYARGVGADYPASRYMDTLAVGAAVNGLAVLWLLTRRNADGAHRARSAAKTAPGGRRPPRTVVLLGLAWLGVFSFGVRIQMQITAWELPDAKKYYGKAEPHVLGYLVTGNPAHLAFEKEIPYPSADSLIERLTHPFLRALMPVEVRPSLPLTAAGQAKDAGFRENRAFAPTPENAPRLGLAPATPPLPLRPTFGSFGDDGAKTIGQWQSLPLTAPLGGWLRFNLAGDFDRGDAPGLKLNLVNAQTGAIIARVLPQRLRANAWRAVYVRAPRGPFVIDAGDDSATGWLAFSAPVELGKLSYAAILAARSGGWLAALGVLGALALAGRGMRGRVVQARDAPPLGGELETNRIRRVTVLALAACLFLLVWGVKLFAVGRYGSDLAFWDQWGKEGDHLYIPWLEHGEFWANLFVPHNEHRIAPTLAVDLAIVAFGGQWDSRLQCVVSAALHALVLAGLWWWALRHLRRGWALASGVLLAAIGAACLAVDNVLTGFQSQFYFLIGFSLLAIGGLLNAPAFSWRWWGGFGAGLAALVSMGSGFLCAVPIVVVAAGRMFSREGRRDAMLTLLAGVALAALGAWLRTPTPWHEALRAHSAGEFFLYVARCLAWPWHTHPWFAAAIWTPWAVLLVRHGRPAHEHRGGTRVPRQAADFVLAAGAWVLLQVAAVSFARGGSGVLPAGRYGDVFSVGAIASFFALALLARQPSRRLAALGAAWLGALVAAIVVNAIPVWQQQLPHEKATRLVYEQNVREFVLTDDFAAFEKEKLPFPLADWLARILRHPKMRDILPVSVRPSRWTHAMHAAGEWRSAPLPPANGWWKIETKGALGDPGTALEVRALSDGRLLGSIAPSRRAGDAWRAAYVAAPRERAVLVARLDDAARGFEFTEPVVMSTLGYRGWRLTRQGHWFALAGGVAGLALAAWWMRHGSRAARLS